MGHLNFWTMVVVPMTDCPSEDSAVECAQEVDMAEVNSTISIIQSSQFKWTFQVQYKESLNTRDEAILYASRHACNLIVQYSKRSGPQFDVLQDPELVCTTGTNCAKVETVPVIIEPESVGWSRLMLRRMFSLAKRVGSVAGSQQGKTAMAAVPSQAMASE